MIFTTELDAILPGNYFKENDLNGFGREFDPAYRILLSSQVKFQAVNMVEKIDQNGLYSFLQIVR